MAMTYHIRARDVGQDTAKKCNLRTREVWTRHCY